MRGAVVDGLAAREGDDAPVMLADRVIARAPSQGPKGIGSIGNSNGLVAPPPRERPPAPPAGGHPLPARAACPARRGSTRRSAPEHGGARRRAAPGAREGWERAPRPRRRALADAILRQDMVPPRGPAPAPRGRRAGALAGARPSGCPRRGRKNVCTGGAARVDS